MLSQRKSPRLRARRLHNTTVRMGTPKGDLIPDSYLGTRVGILHLRKTVVLRSYINLADETRIVKVKLIFTRHIKNISLKLKIETIKID